MVKMAMNLPNKFFDATKTWHPLQSHYVKHDYKWKSDASSWLLVRMKPLVKKAKLICMTQKHTTSFCLQQLNVMQSDVLTTVYTHI